MNTPAIPGAPRLPLTGGCLCGAIRYEVTAAPLGAYACHCMDCQKQSASAFALAVPVLRSSFRVTAGTPVAWTRTSPSGATVLSASVRDSGNSR